MPNTLNMQDKENRGTPSTAYISSRLGLASPALHTPSGASAHDPDGEAASKAVSLCNDAHTTSTPSGRMDFSHLRPCMVDKDHSTPISAEPSAEPALPVGPVSEQRHSSQLGPAHSCAQQSGAEADPLAKWQQSTDTNAGASPAHPMVTLLCT